MRLMDSPDVGRRRPTVRYDPCGGGGGGREYEIVGRVFCFFIPGICPPCFGYIILRELKPTPGPITVRGVTDLVYM